MPTGPRRPRGAQPEIQTRIGTAPGRRAAEWLGTEEDAFNLWLRQNLHETFDAVFTEPVPDDILMLIEEDRAERERLRRSRQTKQGK
jgi:hypothetical protein